MTITASSGIKNKAKMIQSLGFGVKDSLHLACSIDAQAKYFITVDKGILKKRDLIKEIILLNPLDFIELEEDL